ncbi:MAG TPA: PAS domain-containing protein [Puia sp.]|nr:PAS domain-containing protein [Puia sp.]
MSNSPQERTIQSSAGQSSCPEKPMAEIISNGFFIVDPKWIVQHWNKAAEDLLAIRADDIVGHNLWKALAGIVPSEFYAVCKDAFLWDIPNHPVQYWEEMGAWFDVVTCCFEDRLSVSFKSRHQLTRKLPQARVKRLNDLYRYVTEVTNDCIWELDISEKELYWIDGGHKRVFGYPIVNAIVPQQFWGNLLHPDDRVRVLTRLDEIIAAGTAAVWEDEYRFQKADRTYAYVRDRAHIIYNNENKPSRMIGATQDITARKMAESRLVESERNAGGDRLKMQKEFTEALLAAQERERADIGRELHDNLNQILGAAKMYIELAKTDEINRETCLNKSSSYLMTVIEAIRNISRRLTIPEKHIMGLSESINILLDDLAATEAIKIEFTEDGLDESSLSEKLRLDILRIVQEQLNNILKHAKASFATIQLTQQKSHIILQIRDNGRGCNTIGGGKGIGILNIKSRAESHGGNVKITSDPGKGCELKVELPISHYEMFG